MARQICRHCFLPLEDHCAFDPFTQPITCVCDPGTWGKDIPPACDAYVGEAGQYCEVCEHDEACHAKPTGTPCAGGGS